MPAGEVRESPTVQGCQLCWDSAPRSVGVSSQTVQRGSLHNLTPTCFVVCECWLRLHQFVDLKKKNWRSTACLCTLSKGCSAESWAAVSSPRWVEGLAFCKDLSMKKRPALSPSAYYDEFLQGPQIFWVPDKIVFFEKVKVCWFSIKSFSNSDDFWYFAFMKFEGRPSWALSKVRSLKIILMIDHPFRGISVTDITMIKFLLFSWKMFHSVYNNCKNNNCKMLVRIAIYFRK